MKALSLPGLLLSIVGWVLTVMVATHILSGPYEARECQTSCVQTLFASGFGAAALALLLGLIAFWRASDRRLSAVVLFLSVPLFAIFAGIVGIGVLAS